MTKGLVHNQLHRGNKGLTYDDELYIGDMESLFSIKDYEPYGKLVAKWHALKTVLTSDLDITLKMKVGGFVKFTDIHNRNLQDCIFKASLAFTSDPIDALSITNQIIESIELEIQKGTVVGPDEETSIKDIIAIKLLTTVYPLENGAVLATADDKPSSEMAVIQRSENAIGIKDNNYFRLFSVFTTS